MLILAALCVSTVGFSLTPTSAVAELTYVPAGTIPVANFTPAGYSQLYAESVAVDDHNGHIYVADSYSGEVLDYSSASDTSPEIWNGSETPNGSFGGGRVSVAVDNSSGDVYVANPGGVIDKFDQNGKLIASFGDTTPSPNGQLVGVATPAGSFNPNTSYYGSFAIAVDQATHDLYVVDGGHEAIDIFDESGIYLKQITATPAGLYEGEYGNVGGSANGIAVNAASGDLYIGNYNSGEVYEFNSSGTYLSAWDGGALPNGASSETPNGNFGGSFYKLISLASDDTTGHVFVFSWEYAAVDIYDASGNFIPPQLNGTSVGLQSGQGIAIDQADEDLYVSIGYEVQIFKPVVVPDVSLNSAANITATSTTLSGHIDPVGAGNVTKCSFEYGLTSAYGQSAPCAEGGSFSAPADVHADLQGLTPGTEYRYRLLTANANGSNFAVGRFTTIGRYGFSTNLGSAGSGDGQLLNPDDVAVDNSTGDIYVADTGNHRVVKLDASGHFLAAWGWGVSDGSNAAQVCSSGCQAGIAGAGAGQFTTPSFIEVDNSTGPSAGDVYVADTADGVVQKFDPSGQLVSGWESGGSATYEEGIAGIAVKSNGSLVVQPGGGQGIDVDSLGDVFGGPVAIDRSTSEQYDDTGTEIHAFNVENALIDSFGDGNLNSAEGLAFDGTTRVIYVANSGDNDLAVFVPLAVPEVSTGPATSISLTSAIVSGHIDPGDAGSVESCSVEYGTDTTYSLGAVPCSPAGPLSAPTEVSAELTGLTPFIPYHYRVVAVNADGTNFPSYGRDHTVTPTSGLTPTVSAGLGTDLTPTTVTLTAAIDPNSAPTSYRFQYGSGTSYGSQTPPSESIGSDNSDHPVSETISELQPGTTYHFRVVAINFNGVSEGSDGTFNTPDRPAIAGTAASGLTESSANLSATVQPGFRSTTYHFEYGPTPAYGSSTAESQSVGADNTPHSASAPLSGLSPLTVYHFRIVATNSIGTTEGPDQTFTTAAARSIVPPPAGCKAGFVKKHGKCVRKARHGRGHHKPSHHRGAHR